MKLCQSPLAEILAKTLLKITNVLLSMKQKTQMLYYNGSGFTETVAINEP